MESRRALEFFIDFLITALIQNFLFMFFIILPLTQNRIANGSVILRAFIITFFSIQYMVFRDAFPRCSVGKVITKLCVIDDETGKKAGVGKRILRNIFWMLGPVELIVFLACEKRLGDMVAKTTVVKM